MIPKYMPLLDLTDGHYPDCLCKSCLEAESIKPDFYEPLFEESDELSDADEIYNEMEAARYDV